MAILTASHVQAQGLAFRNKEEADDFFSAPRRGDAADCQEGKET